MTKSAPGNELPARPRHVLRYTSVSLRRAVPTVQYLGLLVYCTTKPPPTLHRIATQRNAYSITSHRAHAMLARLVYHLRGVALVAPWAVALLLQDLALSLLLLLLRPANPLLAYRLSSHIAWSCWAWIQAIFEKCNGAKIVISGDYPHRIPRGESAVVIANHVAWCDFYMIQALALKLHMLGYCRYFAKAQLKKVPLLGWGLMAMGMPLVTRNCMYVLLRRSRF